MFLAVNQSLHNSGKKKRKRRSVGGQQQDDSQDDPAEGPPAVPPLESSASSDQLVDGSGSGSCQVCKCPGRQSLVLIYIYLGALTLILASLAIVCYTHVQDQSSSSPVDSPPSARAFRAQFQAELMRSEDVLRTVVGRILESEHELETRYGRVTFFFVINLKEHFVGSTIGSSSMPRRDPLKNERKFTDNLISHTPRPTGKRMRRDIAASAPASMHGKQTQLGRGLPPGHRFNLSLSSLSNLQRIQ